MPAGITQLPGLRSYPCDRLRMFSVFVYGKNLAGTEAAEGVGFLYGHDVFFLLLEVFLHQRDVLIGYILDLFFGIFGLVFAEAILL
jgi:hypothetical protein